MSTQNKTTSEKLQNLEVNIKIKLAGLWTAVTFFYIYGDYFELYTPEKVQSLLSGENILNTPTTLFIASAVLAIPSIMIFLSLILKPKINRLLNIITGVLFTIIVLLVGIGSLTKWYSFYVFYAFVEAILTSIIIWNAVKWPKAN